MSIPVSMMVGAHQHSGSVDDGSHSSPAPVRAPHLTVTDGDPRLRHQLRQLVGGFLDVLNVIKQIVDLAAAQRFAQDRLRAPPGASYSRTKVFTARRRAGGVAMIGRSRIPLIAMFSVRGIGVAVRVRISTSARIALMRSLCRTPNRCSSSTISSPEIAQLHLALQQPAGADQDIDFAFRGLLEGSAPRSLGAAEAGEHFDAYRPGWRNDRGNCHSAAGASRVVGTSTATCLWFSTAEEGGAHGHFGLAEAHIAAHQAVHGQRLAHIAEDGVDRLRLIRRGFKWKPSAEPADTVRGRV